MKLTRQKNHISTQLLDLLSKDDDWLILINADPDAMASALALKRIMSHRVGEIAITNINKITRPDNLAMIKFLNIPLIPYDDTLPYFFNKFAIVDSQPHHNKAFSNIDFSIIIDHHPISKEHSYNAPLCDIRQAKGTTSSIMAEYLYNLHICPSEKLATAMLYGIKTDTANLIRDVAELDLIAYNFLNKYANHFLLQRIVRSEYLPEWLKYFSKAFNSLHKCGNGNFTYAGEVESPDILVVLADFFLRVHGLKWIAVGGVYDKTVIVVFRGSSPKLDLGAFAASRFAKYGSAGGHKSMSRAEFPLSQVQGKNVEIFLYKHLKNKKFSI